MNVMSFDHSNKYADLLTKFGPTGAIRSGDIKLYWCHMTGYVIMMYLKEMFHIVDAKQRKLGA